MSKTTPPKASRGGTLRDFRESWHLLKSNYRAFLGTEFFAIGAFILVNLCLFAIELLVNPNFATNFSRDLIQSISYRIVIISVGYILLATFINCQTGLAFDVMSSGEMCTAFKSAFSYFRQYWWKYILISQFMGGTDLLINTGIQYFNLQHSSALFNNPIGFIMYVLGLGVGFLWYCLMIQSLASINAQGSFWRSIRESFRIFRANPKRILSTWGLYYLIFVCPTYVFESFIGFLAPPLEDLRFLVVISLMFFGILLIFIGFPMRALLVTGLYNNVEFERFPAKMKRS